MFEGEFATLILYQGPSGEPCIKYKPSSEARAMSKDGLSSSSFIVDYLDALLEAASVVRAAYNRALEGERARVLKSYPFNIDGEVYEPPAPEIKVFPVSDMAKARFIRETVHGG